MKHLFKVIVLLSIFILNTGISLKKVNYTKGKNNNVCKELTGEILVYFIFVDSKETSPWTEFDIQSTIDSLDIAVRWLENQAKERNQRLKIKTDYYIGNEFTTVSKNLPNGSVISSATEPNFKTGLSELNKWADNIARTTGQSFNIKDKDGIPDIKSPRDKERLVAFLRDENNVESVALLYLVNNYFRTDISIPVNTLATDDIEFGIISYKYPSVIAHNIMHLYGAADLFETPYRRHEKNIRDLLERYPDDIMQDVYGRGLGELNIGAYTEYLIGWRNSLSPELKPYLTDKFYNF
jgi:hypothetical protein